MAQIIQNAVRIVETGQFLVSSHVHDFRAAKLSNGEEVVVDGGMEYFRRISHSPDLVEDYSLTDESSMEEMKNKFLCFFELSWIKMIDMDSDYLKTLIKAREGMVLSGVRFEQLYYATKIRFRQSIAVAKAIIEDRANKPFENMDDFI